MTEMGSRRVSIKAYRHADVGGDVAEAQRLRLLKQPDHAPVQLHSQQLSAEAPVDSRAHADACCENWAHSHCPKLPILMTRPSGHPRFWEL